MRAPPPCRLHPEHLRRGGRGAWGGVGGGVPHGGGGGVIPDPPADVVCETKGFLVFGGGAANECRGGMVCGGLYGQVCMMM